MIPEKIILDQLSKAKYYFFIKDHIPESKRNLIVLEISRYFDETIESFTKKGHIGENDSILASLIRQDSVEEFITYINWNSYSLSSKIKLPIFETNSFLINKYLSFIEYTAFFGSIQIVQYLIFNKVQIYDDL